MATSFRVRLSRLLRPFHGFLSIDNGAASSHVNFPDPAPPLLRRRHPPLVSLGCCRPSCRHSLPSKRVLAGGPPPQKETPAYLWWRWKEDKWWAWWHFVPCAASSVDVEPSLVTLTEDKLRRRRRGLPLDGDSAVRLRKKVASKRRPSSRRRRRSGSYFSVNEDDSRWSRGDEETETLMSSMDVDPSDDVLRRRRRRRSWPSPGGAETVKRLIPCAAPALRESFAVVQLSEDPREDFRRSMAEMVLEKEIFDNRGLEQLLGCFLALNSRQHYAAIIAAFEDIWGALFPATGVAGLCSSSRSKESCG